MKYADNIVKCFATALAIIFGSFLSVPFYTFPFHGFPFHSFPFRSFPFHSSLPPMSTRAVLRARAAALTGAQLRLQIASDCF